MMDVKEAVSRAKRYVSDVFLDEGAFNVGLEEVEFDGELSQWRVTVGFSRSWDILKPLGLLAPHPERTYKVVHLRAIDGEVTALKDRTVELAG